jgi:hypothetical protein
MYLKVVGNPLKAAQAMGTKSFIKPGQVLSGPESIFKELARHYPDLFKEIEEDGSQGLFKPSKNKLGEVARVK